MQRYILNRLLLLLLLTSLSTLLPAQVLQWSNPTKLRGSAVFTKVIGEDENGVYLLRYRNKFFTKGIIIEKYSHQLAFEDSRNIDLKKSRLVKIQLGPRGIMVITSEFNRKRQSNTLRGQYYDFNLKPIGKSVEMYDEPIAEFADRGSYRIRVNDAKNLLSMINTEESSNGNVIVNWALYSADFQLIRKKSIEMPHKADEFVLMDFMMNTEGKMALLTRLKKEISKRKVEYKYDVFIWDGNEINDYRLNDSLAFKEVGLSYDRESDELLVISLYGQETVYGIKGVLSFRYNFISKKSKVLLTPFSTEIIDELKITGQKVDNAIPEGFHFLQLVPRSDGGILLIAEQKDIATESDIVMVNGIPQSTSKNIYNFNDVLVLNLSDSGAIDWSHVIHKNQTTINDGGYFSSAVVFVSNNFVQLIYNDQIRNSGDVMQYTIYSNGEVVSRKLLKSELDYVAVIPPEATQVSSNKIIIPTSKNRRFALLKLIYD